MIAQLNSTSRWFSIPLNLSILTFFNLFLIGNYCKHIFIYIDNNTLADVAVTSKANNYFYLGSKHISLQYSPGWRFSHFKGFTIFKVIIVRGESKQLDRVAPWVTDPNSTTRQNLTIRNPPLYIILSFEFWISSKEVKGKPGLFWSGIRQGRQYLS